MCPTCPPRAWSTLADGGFHPCGGGWPPQQSPLHLSLLCLCELLFHPQVQSELATVDKTNQNIQSLARVDFHPACEAAINEQVK